MYLEPGTAQTQTMNNLTFLMTYIMWIPLCALFISLVFTTELAWKAKDERIKKELREKLMKNEPVWNDTRPEFRANPPVPWNDPKWGTYTL